MSYVESTVAVPTAEATLDPAPHLVPDACANCGAARLGDYCHGCGQRHLEGRLTLRQLWRNFTSRFFKTDSGLLHTVLDMAVRPGTMIRRYVEGHRRSYVNPFTYLLFGTALSLFTSRFYIGELRVWMEESMRRSASVFTPEQMERYIDLTFAMTGHPAYVTLMLCIPFALMLRLLFRKTGYNLAETFVFAIFTLGHVSLLGGLLAPLHLFFDVGIGSTMASTYVVYLLVASFSALGFYGRRFGAVFKTILALAVAYACFSLAVSIPLTVYVLLYV